MHDATLRERAFLETLVYKIIEIASVSIMFAEVVLLFSSAVSRYAFNVPLVWSDELASMLLIWMVMLGAVVASWRGEHLRLTIVIRRLRADWQARVEIFVTTLLLVFIAAAIHPIASYVASEWTIRTPILDIPFSWRFIGIPLGLALMFIILGLGIARRVNVGNILGSLLIIGACAVLMWLARPFLDEIGNYGLVPYFVALLGVLIAIGTPLAFAFAIATFAYLAFATDVPLIVIANRFGEGMSNPILSAIPLFIYLGSLMVMSGLARTLVDFLLVLVGRVRGGVSFVVITGMYLVSGISGAKAADMAAIAPVLLPEMERRGSDRGDLVALMAATGAMSETIPPSLVLIATGVITGVSIRALFTAGFLPAAVCAACLAVVVVWRSRKEPRVASPPIGMRRLTKICLAAVPGLLLPVLIRTFVVEGITTATEISAFAIAYTLGIGVVKRSLTLSALYAAAVTAVSLTGAIILIIGFVTSMSWALTQSGFSDELGTLILNLPGGNAGFMLATVAMLIVLGSILEGLPAVVLVGPILFPIAEEAGINSVHYAIVSILAMGIGLFMPPFGIGFYYASAIGGVSPDAIMGKIWLYLGFMLLGTLLVAFVPWLSVGFL